MRILHVRRGLSTTKGWHKHQKERKISSWTCSNKHPQHQFRMWYMLRFYVIRATYFISQYLFNAFFRNCFRHRMPLGGISFVGKKELCKYLGDSKWKQSGKHASIANIRMSESHGRKHLSHARANQMLLPYHSIATTQIYENSHGKRVGYFAQSVHFSMMLQPNRRNMWFYRILRAFIWCG